MGKLNHTNWHSSQALVHGNDVTMHKRHLEKFAISVTPSQIKQRRLGDRSIQINIELIKLSFEIFWRRLGCMVFIHLVAAAGDKKKNPSSP